MKVQIGRLELRLAWVSDDKVKSDQRLPIGDDGYFNQTWIDGEMPCAAMRGGLPSDSAEGVGVDTGCRTRLATPNRYMEAITVWDDTDGESYFKVMIFGHHIRTLKSDVIGNNVVPSRNLPDSGPNQPNHS